MNKSHSPESRNSFNYGCLETTTNGDNTKPCNNNNNPRKLIEVDQVGFSSLPDQVHRKSLKRGFEFTMLVVGDSGLGKSTLVNSLFMTDFYSDRKLDDQLDRVQKTISIKKQTAELEEKGVRLKLTIVDTPGFGDSINAKDSWKAIEEYIDQQFYNYYTHESGYGLERKRIQDTRIHCCLYFIPPYVRGLRPIDIETMKSLQTRVNIVPVIAKADTLTKKELEYLKQNILSDVEKYEIKIYEFPICDSDDEDAFKILDEEIKNSIPFAVIGSNTVIESGNKRIRGRVYPWGIIDIESDCCDFTKLRTFLCSSHMQDLKDLTHDFHYENFRTEYIKTHKIQTPIGSTSLIRGRQLASDETDRLLHQKDIELKKMQDLLAKMKVNINNTPVSNGINNMNGTGNMNVINNMNGTYNQNQNHTNNINNNNNISALISFTNQKAINGTSNINNNSNNNNNANNNFMYQHHHHHLQYQGNYLINRNGTNNGYHHDTRHNNYTNINFTNLTNSTPI